MQPLAALQWAHVTIPLDGATTDSAVEQAVTGAIQGVNQEVHTLAGRVRAVGCRLRFTGRTTMHRAMPSLAARLVEDYRPSFDGISYFVESAEDETRPDVALEEIARSNDPVGLLAERLLVLDRREPPEAYEDLITKAREAVTAKLPATVFGVLAGAGEPPADNDVREALLRSGFKALDQLLAQLESDQ